MKIPVIRLKAHFQIPLKEFTDSETTFDVEKRLPARYPATKILWDVDRQYFEIYCEKRPADRHICVGQSNVSFWEVSEGTKTIENEPKQQLKTKRGRKPKSDEQASVAVGDEW